MPDSAFERGPHLWPSGVSISMLHCSGECEGPPYCEPGLAYNPQDPYYADQCAKDVRDLVIATEVVEHRRGRVLFFVLVRVARGLLDGMAIHEEQNGVHFGDPQVPGGFVHVSAVELFLRVLGSQFPVHGRGGHMLRICLGFLEAMPRRDERLEEWSRRFDDMPGEANMVAILGLSDTFLSCMLLSFSAVLSNSLGIRVESSRSSIV